MYTPTENWRILSTSTRRTTMGAAFMTMKVHGDRAAVTAAFVEAQASDRYEHGHSYSGGFGQAEGLQFLGLPPFATEQAAYDYIVDRADKWGPALVARFGEEPDVWFIGAWCAE